MSALVIRDAHVHDGAGGPPFHASVRVEGDRIVAVGPAAGGRADVVLDADGLALCPGFIDIHGHSDLAVLHPDAPDLLAPFVHQGITTQAVGNCGLGVAPVAPRHADDLGAFMALISPPGVAIDWHGYGDWLAAVEAAGPPLNVVPLVAHGAVRCAVLGAEPGPARGDDLEAMAAHVAAALDEGAFGLSAGLIYPPGLWADTDELVRLCREAAGRDRLFTCHVRGSSETAVDAERELLEIGRRSGVRLQHSHHEAFGAPFWDRARTTLAMEDEARAAGLDVASDVIPYHAVNTTLLAVYPPWALAGGVGELCRRLAEPATLERIADEVQGRAPRWPPWEDGWAHNLVRATGWENVVLLHAASDAHRGWVGHSLAAIARREGRTALACAAEVTRASAGDAMARYHGVTGTEDDDGVLRDLLSHPSHAVAVDVILKGDGVAHPGGHGALPRLLGLYVRERGWFSLAEAIRKATSLPAARLGLPDRGRVAPGMAADLVLFDPGEVAERGTWDDPGRPPRGIEAVVVNGELAVQGGAPRRGRPGRLLRHPPSRPCAPVHGSPSRR